MRSVVFQTGLTVALVSTPNAGIEIKYSEQYKRCMDSGEAARGVTIGMKACLDAGSERWGRRLDRVYGEIIGPYTRHPARRRTIISAQRKWMAYRQGKCEVDAGLTGGTIDRLQAADRRLGELAHKTRELEELRKFPKEAPPNAC